MKFVGQRIAQCCAHRNTGARNAASAQWDGGSGSGAGPPNITKIKDSADVAALIRNGISAQQPDNGVLVVAGPLSNIAEAMALPDMAPLVPKRVRTLVIAVSPDDLSSDLASARTVLQNWPTAIVLVEAPKLVFPGEQLESRFAWAANHPVKVAYEAFQQMPYDAPLRSAAAVLHVARPQSEVFTLSDPGAIEIEDDGRVRFAVSGKKTHRMLRVAPNQRDAATQAIVELITAEPTQQTGPGRGKGKQE